MNNINLTMLRNVLSTFVAVAVLAVLGVGQVQAQSAPFNEDDATVTAEINVVQAIQISNDGNGILNFGDVVPGQSSVTQSSPVNLTVTGHSAATFDLTWTPSQPQFNYSNGDFDWNPSVTVDGADASSSGGNSFGFNSSGEANVTVTGEVPEVPTNVENADLSSDITLTVTYNAL